MEMFLTQKGAGEVVANFFVVLFAESYQHLYKCLCLIISVCVRLTLVLHVKKEPDEENEEEVRIRR